MVEKCTSTHLYIDGMDILNTFCSTGNKLPRTSIQQILNTK